MPVIEFIHKQDVAPCDFQAVAAFIEYVATRCYDEFSRHAAPSQSVTLATQVKDSTRLLELSRNRHFSLELVQAVLNLRMHVSGDCFDELGDNGYRKKSLHLLELSWKLEAVVDKLVRYHLSDEEWEEAEAELADEEATPLYEMPSKRLLS